MRCIFIFLAVLTLIVSTTYAQYPAPQAADASTLKSPEEQYDYSTALGAYGTLAQLEALCASPGLDTDGDGVTDLQEFLMGDPSGAMTSEQWREKFNLALALAVDWTRDVDANTAVDFQERLDQVVGSAVSMPPYLDGLSPTLETQFHKELADLAKNLEYDPAKIYEWVYKNIEFEDYELSRKGALATYRTRRGNQWDQCSLLIALLRISGVPARYVYGENQYLASQLYLVGTGYLQKDFVGVQAWLAPPAFSNVNDLSILSAPTRMWSILIPWHKTLRIEEGINLIIWGDPIPNQFNIPAELDTRNDYLILDVPPELRFNGFRVPMSLDNANFEMAPDTDWVWDTGLGDQPVLTTSTPDPAGNRVARVNKSRAWLEQEVGEILQARYQYEISVWVGRPYGYDDNGSYKIELYAGANVLASVSNQDIGAPVPPKPSESEGASWRKVVLRYTAPSGDPNAGAPLKIRLSTPTEKSSRYTYFEAVTMAKNTPEAIKEFDEHRQQNSVEYFEGVVQNYLIGNYQGKSLKQVPRRETTVSAVAEMLPGTLPTEIAEWAFYGSNNDTTYTDVSEIDPLDQTAYRSKTELAFIKNGDYLNDLAYSKILTGYWPFDTSTHANEAPNVAPGYNQWQITHKGSVMPLVSGRIDSAEDFSGSGKYFELGDYYDPENPATGSPYVHSSYSARTIMFWVKRSGSGNQVIYDRGGVDIENASALSIRMSGGYLQVQLKTGIHTASPTTTKPPNVYIPSNTWTHVAVVFDGERYDESANPDDAILDLYVDGKLKYHKVVATNQILHMGASFDASAIGAKLGTDAFSTTNEFIDFRTISNNNKIYVYGASGRSDNPGVSTNPDTGLRQDTAVGRDAWIAYDLLQNYAITSNTIMEFDVAIADMGSYHAIGLDNNYANGASESPERLFWLAGSENPFLQYPHTNDYYDNTEGVTRHVRIDFGKNNAHLYFQGQMRYLVLIADDSSQDAITSIRNLRIYNKPSYADKFAGTLDDFRVYESALAADEIAAVARDQVPNQEEDLVRREGSEGIMLVQTAGRRLTLSFEEERMTNLFESASPLEGKYLKPRLLLDGEVFAKGESNDTVYVMPNDDPDYYDAGYDPANRNPNLVNDVPTVETFRAEYRWPGDGANPQWYRRPSIDAGAVVNVNLDRLAVSQEDVNQAKRLVADRDVANVKSANVQTHESYVGVMADVMGKTWTGRSTRNILRYHELTNQHVVHIDRTRSAVFIWTYPDDPAFYIGDQEGTASELLFHPQWRIDAANYNGIALGHTTDGFRPLASDYLNFTIRTRSDAASGDEANVFEDWQGTPGTSTVKGIFSAHLDGIAIKQYNQATVGQLGTDLRSLYLGSPIDETTIQAMEAFLASDPDDTIITPLELVRIVDPSNNAITLFETDVRIEEYNDVDNTGVAWLFGQYNGGFSSNQIDYVNTVGFSNTNPLFSFNGSTIDYSGYDQQISQLANAAQTFEFGYNTFNDATANRTHNAPILSGGNTNLWDDGDPVDLVTGEYYLAEPADLSVKSRGLTFSVSRHYRSQLIYDGPFGFGWAWSHAESLTFESEASVRTAIIYHDAQRRPKRFRDEGGGVFVGPPGTTVSMSEDASNNEITVTHKNGTVFVFDNTDGRLKEKRDVRGNKLTFNYDMDRLEKIQDSVNRSVEFTYNASDKIMKATDHNGRSIEYYYGGDTIPGGLDSTQSAQLGASNDLVAFKDAEGNLFYYHYIKDHPNILNVHNMIRHELPEGDYLEVAYYGNDTVSHHANDQGDTFHFQYSLLNRYAETWNEKGVYRKAFWNRNGDIIRINTRDDSLEFREYDDDHNMLSETDGNGNTVRYQYNNKRDVVSITNAENESTVYKYNTLSKVTDEYVQDGEITPDGGSYKYQAIHNRISYDATHHDKPVTIETAYALVEIECDAIGVPVLNGSFEPVVIGTPQLLQAPVYHKATMTYDAHGNVLTRTEHVKKSHTDPEVPIIISHDYDTLAVDLVQTTNARGNASRFTYDDYGRVISVIDPLRNTTQTQYNLLDNPIAVVDGAGNVTRTVYDGNERPREVRAPNGAVVQYEYATSFYVESKDRVAKQIDPLGNQTVSSYDERGYLVATTDSHGNVMRYKYDGMGRVIETIDALGYSINNEYDGAGRLTATTEHRDKVAHLYVGKNDTAPDRDEIVETNAERRTEISYDDANRMILRKQLWESQKAVEYDYDTRGNLVEERHGYFRTKIGGIWVDANGGDLLIVRRVVSQCDDQNRVTQRTIEDNEDPTDARDRKIEFEYDSVGRLLKKISMGVRAWDSNGDPVGSIADNLIKTEYVYDLSSNVGQLTSWHYDHSLPGWVLDQQVDNVYDDRNLLVRQTTTRGVHSVVVHYEHDQLRRQIAVWRDVSVSEVPEDGTVVHGSQTTYDEMGNVVLTETYVGGEWDSMLNRFVGGTRTSYVEATYSLRNEQLTTTDAHGSTKKYEYDALGRVIASTDESGHVTRHGYDALNRIVSTHDAIGNITRIEYDRVGNVLATIDATGARVEQTFNLDNQITSRTTPEGRADYLAYDEMGRGRCDFNQRDASTEFTTLRAHNGHGEIESVQRVVTPVGGGTDSIEQRIRYDGLGRKVFAANPRQVAAYEAQAPHHYGDLGFAETVFDSLSLPLSVTIAKNAKDSGGADLEQTTLYQYNALNKVIHRERGYYDATSAFITLETIDRHFDELGRTLSSKISDPNDGTGNSQLTTTTRYNDAKREVAVTDPYGMTSNTTADALGRVVATTDADGYVTTSEYDRRSNLIRKVSPTEASEAAILFEYDKLNRLVRSGYDLDDDGSLSGSDPVRKLTYDQVSRVIEETDYRGIVTRHAYDLAGRRIRTALAVGTDDEMITEYEYDLNANLRKVVVHNDYGTGFDVPTTQVEYQYDEINRKIRQIDPDMSFCTYEYDVNSNVKYKTRRDGSIIKRIHDAHDRLTKLEYDIDGVGSGSGFVVEQEFRYDRQSQLMASTDFNRNGSATSREIHTVAYRHDYAHRIVSEITYEFPYQEITWGPFGRVITTAYLNYADSPNEIGLEIVKTYPGDGATPHQYKYRYDRRGLLSNIYDANNARVIRSCEYDATGHMTSYSYESPTDGVYVMSGMRSIDARGRESARTYINVIGVKIFLNQFSFYDPNSNITNESYSSTELPHINGPRYYNHDFQDRVTLRDDNADKSTPDSNFAYDKIGNWTTVTRPGVINQVRTANESNEYTQIGGQNQTYDAVGNLTNYVDPNGPDYHYVYDWANRLIEVQDQSQQTLAEYTYDAANRRITKAVGSNKTWYAYDGPHVISEYTDTATTGYFDKTGKLRRVYVYGSKVDQPVLMEDTDNTDGTPAETYFYVCDRLGSVRSLVNTSTRQVVESYDYDVFGEMTMYDNAGVVIGTNVSAIGNPFGYTARRYDAESSLWYYRNRMYSTTIGRFLQRDPAGYVDGFNQYNYVVNNPLAFTDPRGLYASASDKLEPLQIGIGLDGTWNHPEQQRFGKNKPTNVVKILEGYKHNSVRIYRRGVGNKIDNNWFGQKIGGGLGYGQKDIIDSAILELENTIARANSQGKSYVIDIYGYSRGGTAALELANRINDGIRDLSKPPSIVRQEIHVPGGYIHVNKEVVYSKIKPKIRILGLYDPVGAFGWPRNQIDVGYRKTVPPNVDYAYRQMALNEERAEFPALKITGLHRDEIFAGYHSSIGGGAYDDRRSDISLGVMISEARARGASIDLRAIEKRFEFNPNPASLIYDPYPDWKKSLSIAGPRTERTAYENQVIHPSVYETSNAYYAMREKYKPYIITRQGMRDDPNHKLWGQRGDSVFWRMQGYIAIAEGPGQIKNAPRRDGKSMTYNPAIYDQQPIHTENFIGLGNTNKRK